MDLIPKLVLITSSLTTITASAGTATTTSTIAPPTSGPIKLFISVSCSSRFVVPLFDVGHGVSLGSIPAKTLVFGHRFGNIIFRVATKVYLTNTLGKCLDKKYKVKAPL